MHARHRRLGYYLDQHHDWNPRTDKPPSIPDRYSSAVCPYWTTLGPTSTTALGPLEISTPALANEPYNPYLEALKQFSATHRSSLDNLPLDRLLEVTPHGLPTINNPHGRTRDGGSDHHQPLTTGQIYHHRSPDGRVYTNTIDATALGHSSVNKVRPARGIRPFMTITATNHVARSGVGGETVSLVQDGGGRGNSYIVPGLYGGDKEREIRDGRKGLLRRVLGARL